MANALLRFVAHPRAVAAHILGQPLRTAPFRRNQGSRLSAPPGEPAARPANFGGISIIALLMSTATGFRSLA